MKVTRRGRPRPARRVLQQDGAEPAAEDPAAGGAVAGAAAVRLRRLARAADAADDRPDGRRRAPRRARGLRPGRPRGRPSCCRTSWTGSRRCSPTCWRSAGSTRAPRRWRPSRSTCARSCGGWSSGAEPLAERKGTRDPGRAATEQPVHRRGRRPARRAGAAQPRRQRRRARRGPGRRRHGWPPAGDAVAVAVRDYGVGLKPGEATLVFNRFWRADPARARTTGGTGLGLSIALEDARLHGGWLQAWGEPGGGSQFRLTLPRTADEPLRGSPIPLEPEDSRRNRGLNAAALPAGAAARPPCPSPQARSARALRPAVRTTAGPPAPPANGRPCPPPPTPPTAEATAPGAARVGGPRRHPGHARQDRKPQRKRAREDALTAKGRRRGSRLRRRVRCSLAPRCCWRAAPRCPTAGRSQGRRLQAARAWTPRCGSSASRRRRGESPGDRLRLPGGDDQRRAGLRHGEEIPDQRPGQNWKPVAGITVLADGPARCRTRARRGPQGQRRDGRADRQEGRARWTSKHAYRPRRRPTAAGFP